MNIGLEQILMVAGILWCGGLYYSGIRVREIALRAGRDYCQNVGLQMLDQTVSRQRISLSQDHERRWRVWRSFTFEFTSDGERRYAGEIITLGAQVLEVRVEIHRMLH